MSTNGDANEDDVLRRAVEQVRAEVEEAGGGMDVVILDIVQRIERQLAEMRKAPGHAVGHGRGREEPAHPRAWARELAEDPVEVTP